MTNVITVITPDQETNEYHGCKFVLDNADRSICVENRHGDTVAHYKRSKWATVIQEVKQ